MTPRPYFERVGVAIYHGDCREVLPTLSALTAIVSDPPYGLSFMGKGWDRGVPGLEFWQLARAACSPGAPLLAFGGTRTFHRLACAIEDAGWEIRDCLSWLYGAGFPKSLDVSKAVDAHNGDERPVLGGPKGRNSCDGNPCRCPPNAILGRTAHSPNTSAASAASAEWSGYGTALKPAWEPIVLAMAPLAGTFAENALAHGVAGLNVEGCRIETQESLDGGAYAVNGGRGASPRLRRGPSMNVTGKTTGREFVQPSGRWPANVALDAEAARMLDEQAPATGAAAPVRGTEPSAAANHVFGQRERVAGAFHGDAGGASRFFYTAKADRESFNTHPTVKPTDLMRWLVRLVAMPSRNLICDPFMGSGSTLVAARDEHVPCVGIELDERSCEIAAKRLAQDVLPFEPAELGPPPWS